MVGGSGSYQWAFPHDQGRSVGRSSTKCSGIQTGWRTDPTLLQGRYLSAEHTMRGASVRMNMAERETLLWVTERWRTKRDALHHGINRFGRRLLRLCDRMYGCNIGNRRVGQKGRLGWYTTAIPLLHRVVCVVEKDVAPPDPCSGARLERVTYRIHNLNASVRVKNSVTSAKSKKICKKIREFGISVILNLTTVFQVFENDKIQNSNFTMLTA